MKSNTQLVLTEGYQDSEIQFIINQIEAFNHSTAPTAQESGPLNLILKDEDGHILGGVLGRCYRYALYINVLWISEQLRGQGYGSKLLEEMESISRARGCKLVHLDTWDFQALDFYKKHGFEVFGTLEGFPEGFKRYFLRKSL
ncbi:GNAT family N-acetyltransferase [Paenibacillus sp. N1-5-1-14]|uniref:GNAT family N-acetyltransferase n=1 Tax=Paenibacillus radicibacter TaxID=2972488 RepID=UPI002158C579|nr:GNAT family N-acetyltransferase [Paenibacillus radicibacter]MCR8642017.1 GNAT family N-acetyltransferase [Paenibacillus radicibacter]